MEPRLTPYPLGPLAWIHRLVLGGGVERVSVWVVACQDSWDRSKLGSDLKGSHGEAPVEVCGGRDTDWVGCGGGWLGVASPPGEARPVCGDEGGPDSQQSWGMARSRLRMRVKRWDQGQLVGSRSVMRPARLTSRPGMATSWVRTVAATVS